MVLKMLFSSAIGHGGSGMVALTLMMLMVAVGSLVDARKWREDYLVTSDQCNKCLWREEKISCSCDVSRNCGKGRG